MLVYFALGDAKVWLWGSKPTPGPNANGFASQWNIGFSLYIGKQTSGAHPLNNNACGYIIITKPLVMFGSGYIGK